jgi:hypothetical protein
MASVQGGIREWRTGGINRGAADRKFFKVKLMVKFVCRFAKHSDCRASYFGPDPVSRQ